jgi:hypothetical protein
MRELRPSSPSALDMPAKVRAILDMLEDQTR